MNSEIIEVWSVDSGNRLATFASWLECDLWLVDLAAANPDGIGNLVCGETWDANDRLEMYRSRRTGTSAITMTAGFAGADLP